MGIAIVGGTAINNAGTAAGNIPKVTPTPAPTPSPTPAPTTVAPTPAPTPSPTPASSYGTGPWQITMNIAESNTMALAFAAIPFDNNVGSAVDWNPLEQYTEYSNLQEVQSVSYNPYESPQSNLNVVGTTSWAITGDDQGLTVIADALVGASSSPNFARGPFRGASHNTNVLSTFFNCPNDGLTVACISSEGGVNSTARTVTSVTGGGYTWQLRKRYIDPNSNCGQAMEVWYAITTIEGSGYINVTFSDNIDAAVCIASSWELVNLSQPWTTSGASTSNNNN